MIINTLGAIVMKGKITNQYRKINTIDLDSGFYMLRIWEDNEIESIKFIKKAN